MRNPQLIQGFPVLQKKMKLLELVKSFHLVNYQFKIWNRLFKKKLLLLKEKVNLLKVSSQITR